MKNEETALSTLRVLRNSPLNMNYQIKKGIHGLVSQGKLPAGSRIPSVQRIAEICGVSLNTAKYVVRDLIKEGVLESRSGIGTFVSEGGPLTTEILICDSQPEPGSTIWAFHRQIIDGLMEGYSEIPRRFLTVYTEEHVLSAKEILASARAKYVDCVIAYNPTGDFSLSLAEVSYEILCITLGHLIPNSMAHAVVINPAQALRTLLQKRLESGIKNFAFLSLELQRGPEYEEMRSPYLAIYKVFLEVMEEAGIEPAVCLIDRKPWKGFPGLKVFQKKLTDDTTLVCLPSGANSVLEERWQGLDFITYTECRTSIDKLIRRRRTALYGGLERCGAEAACLHKELLRRERADAPVYFEIEPEIVESR